MITHDIETESLEAHVSLCQERYLALERRMVAIENRMDEIGTMVAEVKTQVERLNERHTNRWDRGKDAVIGLLVACLGVLLVRFVL